jgi:hypothetical protein
MPKIEKRHRITPLCHHCRLPITDDTMATETFGTMVKTWHGSCYIKEMNMKPYPETYPAKAPVRPAEAREGGMPSTVPSSVGRGV